MRCLGEEKVLIPDAMLSIELPHFLVVDGGGKLTGESFQVATVHGKGSPEKKSVYSTFVQLHLACGLGSSLGYLSCFHMYFSYRLSHSHLYKGLYPRKSTE
jgi:hypothetical protein